MIPYAEDIRRVALKHHLDPLDVMALIKVESGFNAYAWNPEPGYRYLWDVRKRAPWTPMPSVEGLLKPPPGFPALAGDPDQEWWAQRASWGLMQIMGAVAREVGFLGPYLTELTDPLVNLEYGCVKLARVFGIAGSDKERAFATWNGGPGGNAKPPYRNAAYAAKVLAAKKELA
jgi:soluble lytic murein transglycosylase-like protein